MLVIRKILRTYKTNDPLKTLKIKAWKPGPCLGPYQTSTMERFAKIIKRLLGINYFCKKTLS